MNRIPLGCEIYPVVLGGNYIHTSDEETILKEELSVVGTDTISYPVTMMIHFHGAFLTEFAVTSSSWFQCSDFRFRIFVIKTLWAFLVS